MGSTTATGLGQFVIKTGRDYGINDQTRWDMNVQANALVRHFIDNKKIANSKSLPEQYIYKFHHDGPIGEYVGLAIGLDKVYPKIKGISNVLHKLF